MKQILFLLSLSGILLADQTFVITFGTDDKNSHTTESARDIMNNSDSLTYNVVSVNDDYHIASPLLYTNNSESNVSMHIYHEESQKKISTNKSQITAINGAPENLMNLHTIFGGAEIAGVLTTTNDNTFHIKFSGLHESSYTLYVLGARGGASGGGSTNYSLTGASSLTIPEKNQIYNGAAIPTISGNTITASTFNSNTTITNWLLMQFDFTTSETNSSVKLSSWGNDGNIAAIALVAHTIPEPTTTTLSLLALAALAGRRRRK